MSKQTNPLHVTLRKPSSVEVFNLVLVLLAIGAALLGSGRSHGMDAPPSQPQTLNTQSNPASKFAHRGARVLVFAGQNLADTKDYYDHPNFPKPVGFSDYISYDVGTQYPTFAPDYPAKYQGNDGLLKATNWGSGEQCADCLLREPNYRGAMINLGMYLAGPAQADGSMCSGKPHCTLHKISSGQLDYLLKDFAQWLNENREYPVLLRIGYEFDGSWNAYDPDQFIAAYKHIYRYLQSHGVTNVAYVYHSFGYASRDTLERFFPHPDQYSKRYVDWIGYSYFTSTPERVGREELKFAREKGLKVFIGEAAPHTGDCNNQIDISKHVGAAKRWINNLDAHVLHNRDVIGAIAYINARWNDREYSPQWGVAVDQDCDGFFAHSNSRLTDHREVADHWRKIISQTHYQHAADSLMEQIVSNDVIPGEG